MSRSHDAEQAVLGGCMLEPAAYWRVADVLTAEDFSDGRHARLWRVIGDLVRDGSAADPVTMCELDSGLGDYPLKMANATPSTANIRAYAEIVAKHAQHRRVVAAGGQIARVGPDDSLGEAQRLLAAAAKPELTAIKAAREVLNEFVADLQRKCDAESELTGLATGFPGLDQMTSGLQPSDLIIIAGRPSMGKTTLAQNIAEYVAVGSDDENDPRPARRVLFFTQEMRAAAVLARSIASLGHVPFNAIRSPKSLQDEHWPRIQNASARLKASGLLFDESCGITAEQLCARARQCHNAAPLSLIVIDYLQYMRLPQAASASLAVQEVTRELKALAKALNVPVLLLSQLNRSLEARADKRPVMADLRESGAIEQDADVIAFIYRDEVYHAGGKSKGFAELLIRKQRNGEIGTVPLIARLDQMRFEDCPDGLPYDPNEPAGKSSDGGRPNHFADVPGVKADRKSSAAGH